MRGVKIVEARLQKRIHHFLRLMLSAFVLLSILGLTAFRFIIPFLRTEHKSGNARGAGKLFSAAHFFVAIVRSLWYNGKRFTARGPRSAAGKEVCHAVFPETK